MKAGSRFLNAVSAVALSAGVVSMGAASVTFVTVASAEAATVRRIDVRGNSRVDAETIRANVSISPGKSFSDADIDTSVKRLYATGFFSDVRISVAGGSLVVTVAENELINQVVFNGNRKLKDDQLADVVSTKSLGPYSQSMVEADIAAMREAYGAIGRSDVTITTQTVPVGDGRVNLAFVINEGDRTKISRIEFVGNNAYSDGRLQSVITTKESGILTFITRKDVYNSDKLRADEDLLRQFYYNHGYADFRVISSDAQLDESTNEYTVTVTVDEGQKYDFGDVKVESTVDGLQSEDLQGLVESKSGSTYNAKDVQESITAISKKVAAAGYPFARVTPRGDRDYTNNKIAVSYLVDQGERAYVERIEIRGNTRTRDYVIRREFDFSEGDAFNQEMIAAAKRRLDALGFFSSVSISTAPGSASDRVVVVVDVQDQSTGSFGIGAGYVTGGEGFVLEASIEEQNFLGRGQFVRVAAGGGTSTRTYSLSFTEPYFLGYRLAAGFDLYKNKDTTNDNYTYQDQGFTLRIAAPITEDLTAKLAYNYRKMDYSTSSKGELSKPYVDAVDGSPWVRSSISNTWTYNTLDTQSQPHEGFIGSITQEYAGLGGTSDYYSIIGKARYYYTLNDEADIIGSLSGSAGHILPTSGKLEVFDQFKMGANEVRGFSTSGIGPRMKNGDTLGGTTYFTASAESTFPIPGISRDYNLRGAVFADAGTLYGNEVNLRGDKAEGTSMAWRASVGASVIWDSPFGPLRFDYAIPVKKESFDEEQRFKFGIQTTF